MTRPGTKPFPPQDMADAELFYAQLAAIYGETQAQRIVTQMGQEGELAYWLNPLRDFPFDPIGEEMGTLSDIFIVPRSYGLSHTDAASEGRIYIQNPSSYFAAMALQVHPNQEVLDLAAAPGGKTIALAAAMNNTGRLAAVEPVKGRFHRLKANLERCGVTNVVLYQRDGRGVGRAVPERFDRVLLDAPCSSEARMRWHDPSSYAHWSRRKVKETQRKQKSLIRSAYAALKPGGQMVYCTCSFSPEENELVVQHLLKRTSAELMALDNPPPNTVAGLVQWRGKTLLPALTKTLRILPDAAWDGFYVAKIYKPIEA